jgi:hypothetical protein
MTEKQNKQMAKIFLRSGRTFQSLASEAGLVNVPTHLVDLPDSDITHLIRCFAHYLR